jgi:serine/threonine protein phosphatase PrpC
MRKENADFQTTFISHEGSQLLNNDYFGYVVMDDIACYVIVDGIETGDGAASGRLAAEAAMAAFHANPGMGAGKLRGYIRAAHASLRRERGGPSARASITVAVTDYARLRYGQAGNTRLSLFRAGDLLHASKDHSLSQNLADQGEIPADKIARHEGRNNLSRYLGQKGSLQPWVSPAIQLKSGDILTLYTRGFWEACDSHDLRSALNDAGDDPKKAGELAERLILSAHPAELDNYTFAAVFINKVYVDPNKGKKLKLILKIAIPILILALVAGAVFYVFQRQRRADIRRMERYYLSGVEYTQDNNLSRAESEMGLALELALKLDDLKWQDDIAAAQRLLEALSGGDAAMTAGDYPAAQEYYLRARERSSFTDNLAMEGVDRRLTQVSAYLSVQDMLALGDALTDRGDYALAGERYLAARDLAAAAYYGEGKQQALDALEALYERMGRAAADSESEARAQAADEIKAADFIAQGDKAYQDGDLISADMYYTMAMERYEALGSEAALETIGRKLELVSVRREENQARLTAAAEHLAAGDELMAAGEYAEAKKRLILARDIYAEQRETLKLEEVRGKIETASGYLTE